MISAATGATSGEPGAFSTSTAAHAFVPPVLSDATGFYSASTIADRKTADGDAPAASCQLSGWTKFRPHTQRNPYWLRFAELRTIEDVTDWIVHIAAKNWFASLNPLRAALLKVYHSLGGAA